MEEFGATIMGLFSTGVDTLDHVVLYVIWCRYCSLFMKYDYCGMT